MWQSLLVFLIPLMLSNALQSLSQTIGFIYLGRLLGPHALAAAGNLFPIIFLMVSFLLGIGSASSILIGQAHGAGDTERMKRVAGTTLGVGLTLGVIGGALCAIFVRQLLHLIGTPADIFDMSVDYATGLFRRVSADLHVSLVLDVPSRYRGFEDAVLFLDRKHGAHNSDYACLDLGMVWTPEAWGGRRRSRRHHLNCAHARHLGNNARTRTQPARAEPRAAPVRWFQTRVWW